MTSVLFKFLLLIFFFESFNCQSNGLPIGILVDQNQATELVPLVEKLVDFINTKNEFGKNRWAFQIHILKSLDTNEIINAICNQMSRGVLALFGGLNLSSYNSIKSFVDFYNIPFFTWSYPLYENDVYYLKNVYTKQYDFNNNEYDLDKNDKNEYDLPNLSDASRNQNDDLYNNLNVENKKNSQFESKKLNYLVNMHPEITPVLISLVKYNRWKTVYYLYNSDEALNRLEAIFDYQISETDFVTNIQVRKINKISDAIMLIKSIEKHFDQKESEKSSSIFTQNLDIYEMTVMLDFEMKEDYIELLNSIKNLGMTKIKFHYILVSLEINELDLSNFRENNFNITGFSLIDYKNFNVAKQIGDTIQPNLQLNNLKPIPYKFALILDALLIFCNQINDLAGNNLNKLFNLENVSLKRSEIYIDSKKGFQCSNKLNSFNQDNSNNTWPLGQLVLNRILNMKNVEKTTGDICFDSKSRRFNYTIYIYRSALAMPLSKMGSFSIQYGIKILEEAIFRGVDGMQAISRNRKRIIVSIVDEPFMMIKSSANGKNFTGNDRFEGYCVDLAEKLSQMLNFSYELRLVKDKNFGSKDANGNWNGMIGELVRHEADLAVASLTISLARERAVEFSMPFMNLGISIMVYKQEEEKPKLFSFMEPLSNEIWMCFLLAYVGISVILFLVSRFSPYEWRLEQDVDEQSLSNDFTIFNTFWFCLSAFLQQGIDILPRSISGRLVTSVWWFFTLILISSYTANLAAFLTVDRMVSPIESAEDLAKQTLIQYGTVEGGTTKEFFRTSKVPTFQRMWSYMQGFGSSVFVKNNIEGIQKVREMKRNYAFLLESSLNEYQNERKPCNTMKVGSNLDSKGYGIATPIGSDLKEAINLAILQLKEDGYLEELKKKWWYYTSQCSSNETEKSDTKDKNALALHLDNIRGIFFILVIGIVISIIIAAFEILYKARIDAFKSKVVFQEALKSKIRLSITGNEDNISSS